MELASEKKIETFAIKQINFDVSGIRHASQQLL